MNPEQKKQADVHLLAIAAMLRAIEVISQSMSQSQQSDFDLAVNGSINVALDHLDKLHDLVFPPSLPALDVVKPH